MRPRKIQIGGAPARREAIEVTAKEDATPDQLNRGREVEAYSPPPASISVLERRGGRYTAYRSTIRLAIIASGNKMSVKWPRPREGGSGKTRSLALAEKYRQLADGELPTS